MLDNSCFLECGVRAVLLYVAHTLGRDVDEDCLAEFRNEDAALLEVRLAAHLSGWVELGSTRTVGVPSANLRALSCYCAFACHSSRMLAYRHVFEQPELWKPLF